jgi:hypothetical protein
MTEELFDYLMDDLCPERRAAVEARLAADPAWRRELKRLQECLAENGNPGKCLEEPPQDLVERTCCLVREVGDSQEHVCVGSGKAAPLAAAFTAESPCVGAGSKPWTLADLTVGAGILAIVGALVTPALYETRAASRRVLCENNVRTLGGALYDYQLQHNRQLPPVRPGENAGRYTLALLNSGLLTRQQLRDILICPESRLAEDVSTGRFVLYLPTERELDSATGEQLVTLWKAMGGSYAFLLGYRDKSGSYRQPIFTGEQQAPLVADAPQVSPLGARSGNHAGAGQNVLYQNGAVTFLKDSVMPLGHDNIFLNDRGLQAAGIGPEDVVLGPGDCGPDGPLTAIPIQEENTANGR